MKLVCNNQTDLTKQYIIRFSKSLIIETGLIKFWYHETIIHKYIEKGYLTIALVTFETVSLTENLRSFKNHRIISSSSLPHLPRGRPWWSFSSFSFTSSTNCIFKCMRKRTTDIIVWHYLCHHSWSWPDLILITFLGKWKPKSDIYCRSPVTDLHRNPK